MPLLQARNPYDQYFDNSGTPLDNGQVFIGVAGLNPVTDPIQVFFDQDGTIPAPQPIFTRNGYLYRAGTPANIFVDAADYSLLVKDSRGVTMYSALNARSTAKSEDISYVFPDGSIHILQDLSSPIGASGIGAPNGTVADYLPRRRPVSTFGVKADGVTDDSNALEAAILAGVPIHLGSGNIKITRRISALVPGAVDWVSDGAVIVNSSAAETPACIDLEVLPNLDHKIVGILKINGQLLSSVGIRLWNKSTAGFPLGYASLRMADTQVFNIRRGSITSANGDGIIVRGGFSMIIMDRPVVKNVLLAAGAGILGSVGVTGITVFGDSTGYPLLTIINDPDIDTVKSEDPSYSADQDGVRIFGPWATAGAKSNSVFRISGGSFRDCWGRSIKSQAETGVIEGVTFSAFSGPTGGRSSEIDFQIGGGMIQNIMCYYSGVNSAPTEIVGFQPSPDFEAFSGQLSGLQVYTTATIGAIVSTFPRAKTQHKITVEKINVIGPITRLVEFRVWSNKTSLDLSRVSVNNILSELVRVTASGAGGAPFVGKVNVRHITNLGAAQPLVIDKVSGLAATSIVSSEDVEGFTLPTVVSESLTSQGGASRVRAITGMDASGGSIEPTSQTVAAGATVTFPIRGYNGSCAAVVSVGTSNTISHGMVSISPSAVLLLTTLSTDIVAGGATEPVSGNYKMWISGGLVQFKNNTASSRQVSLVFIG